MSRELEVQREITRLALARAGGADGFALAGAGAIREHGLIDRPTQDVDLFTTYAHLNRVDQVAGRVIEDLQEAGYTVAVDRMSQEFARLRVISSDGFSTEVDFGIDWRKNDPVVLGVGPVLGLDDAVASKTIAVYSRAEARDFLDLDAIRAAGSFNDDDLLEAAAQRDPGFDRSVFADQLELARRITIEEVQAYGVDADQLAAVQGRFADWAKNLHGAKPPSITDTQRAQESLAAVNKLSAQQDALRPAEQKPRTHENPQPYGGRAEERNKGRSL